MKSLLFCSLLILMMISSFFSLQSDTKSQISLQGQVRLPGNALPKDMVILLEPLENQSLPPQKKAHKITLKNGVLTPKLSVIRCPQVVFFPIEDKLTHNLYCPSEIMPFDLGFYSQDLVGKSVTIKKPGIFNVYCSLYEEPQATIITTTNELGQITDAQGHFEFANLQPGLWSLKTWQRNPRYPQIKKTLKLPLEEPLILDLKW